VQDANAAMHPLGQGCIRHPYCGGFAKLPEVRLETLSPAFEAPKYPDLFLARAHL
jgi:hypothetical protein